MRCFHVTVPVTLEEFARLRELAAAAGLELEELLRERALVDAPEVETPALLEALEAAA